MQPSYRKLKNFPKQGILVDMNKLLLIAVALIIVLIVGFFILNSFVYRQTATSADYKNAEYVIDGQRVKLENGVAETEAAPGSASKIVTQYFGNEVAIDFNNDNREDIAFLLTQNTGGSGTFYYVVAALNTEKGYVGSEAFLLGDRIAPQTTEISQNPNHKNVIVVNYADRAPNEPMTAQPSIGKSAFLKLDPETMQFGEVQQDFPGEADPSRMSLSMKKWQWISALYNDGRKINPANDRFTITFNPDNKFSATTDCNGINGNYIATINSINFSQIGMTKMFCEKSQETDFLKILENTQNYHFTSKGELIFDLKFDSGTATFK